MLAGNEGLPFNPGVANELRRHAAEELGDPQAQAAVGLRLAAGLAKPSYGTCALLL